MEPFGVKATVLATVMASFLSLRAYKRKSLTSAGSVAAFAVAFFLVGTGLRGFNLFTFYFVSIKATKYKVRSSYSMPLTIDSIRFDSGILSVSVL